MTWLKDLINEPGRQVPPIGTFMKIPSVETVEIVKLAGFDFIVLDAEHALLSLSDLNHMILAARALGLAPIVRVPDHGYGDVQRILDAGAAGLFFPHVADQAECEQVIRQASHPPYGTRGAGGGMRAGNWGMAGRGSASYVKDGVDKVMRIPMIEERIAVDNADEILAVEGVDGVFIGPGDLSMTMGMKMADAEVQNAIEEVLKKAKAARVPVGTVASDAGGARRLIEKGYDFILVSNDTGMLAKTAMSLIDEIRA
ncbi:MAG TPA: aldolase/citrate lyase family protein [Trebonia sp.]